MKCAEKRLFFTNVFNRKPLICCSTRILTKNIFYYLLISTVNCTADSKDLKCPLESKVLTRKTSNYLFKL